MTVYVLRDERGMPLEIFKHKESALNCMKIEYSDRLVTVTEWTVIEE